MTGNRSGWMSEAEALEHYEVPAFHFVRGIQIKARPERSLFESAEQAERRRDVSGQLDREIDHHENPPPEAIVPPPFHTWLQCRHWAMAVRIQRERLGV